MKPADASGRSVSNCELVSALPRPIFHCDEESNIVPDSREHMDHACLCQVGMNQSGNDLPTLFEDYNRPVFQSSQIYVNDRPMSAAESFA
jgi:hypothetical protein